MRSAVMSMGQGIETTLAQIAATKIGVPMSAVRVELGDTKTAPYGSAASIASRSAILAGTATAEAADILTEKVKRIAAHQLEADPSDIVVDAGRIGVRGTSVAGPTLADIARDAWLGWNLPPGSSFNSISASINANAEVAFRVQVVPDAGDPGLSRPGVWLGAHGDGGLVYVGDIDALIEASEASANDPDAPLAPRHRSLLVESALAGARIGVSEAAPQMLSIDRTFALGCMG